MPLSQVLIAAGIVPVLVNILLYAFSTADGVRSDSVRMPRALFWAGTIGSASCLGLTVFLSLFQRRILWSVIAVSAGLLSIVCVLAYYSIRIRYDEDTFLCRRFFSRKIWSYTDIEGVIPGANGDYTLLLKKGKIRVDGMAHGGAQFLLRKTGILRQGLDQSRMCPAGFFTAMWWTLCRRPFSCVCPAWR